MGSKGGMDMKYPIDRKARITLGGMKQAIHIWGTKQENPVVLFLHGGPGVPNRHGMAVSHMDLTDDFTIVAWDQRGTGGSYSFTVAEDTVIGVTGVEREALPETVLPVDGNVIDITDYMRVKSYLLDTFDLYN